MNEQAAAAHSSRLEATLERTSDGWRVRLPVRGEEARMEKRVVVYDEVEIRRELVEEREPIDFHHGAAPAVHEEVQSRTSSG